MFRRPTIRQIDVFRAVIELGTVGKAAAALNMSQPTASKVLGYLEEDSGLRLFDRTNRRLVPTAVGLRLYEEIERIFAGVDQIERAMEALRREEQERLTLCVIPILEGIAVQSAARFLNLHPHMDIAIEIRGSPHIPGAIASQRVDIGLFGGEMDMPQIQSQTVLSRALICIVPPSHPLARKVGVTAEDLADYKLVRHASLNRTQQLIDQLCVRAGVAPQSHVEIATARMMCEFVLAGHGIGIAHPVALSGYETRLAALPLSPDLLVDYQIGWLAKNRNSRLIKTFIAQISAVCDEVA